MIALMNKARVIQQRNFNANSNKIDNHYKKLKKIMNITDISFIKFQP